MTLSTPPLKVRALARFMSNPAALARHPELPPLVEAYLVAVTAQAGRPLLFTVLLENGALFSGLPISALFCEKYGAEVSTTSQCLSVVEAQPWSCLEGPAQIVEYELLLDAQVWVRTPRLENRNCFYLFTIDYHGEGLAQDPEQSKSHNILVTDHGQLLAMPNNYCLFRNEWFTGGRLAFPTWLRRQSAYYRAE